MSINILLRQVFLFIFLPLLMVSIFLFFFDLGYRYGYAFGYQMRCKTEFSHGRSRKGMKKNESRKKEHLIRIRKDNRPRRVEHTKKAITYIVKKGDSIEKIARRHLVLKWQLRDANGFRKGVILHPGQRITIPDIDWSKKTYVGNASWYGPKFHGKTMANGEVFDQHEVSIAHRTLPLGIMVKITNLINGKYLLVRVLDRGPYAKNHEGKYSREIDLSYAAAKFLGAVERGVVPVHIEPF